MNRFTIQSPYLDIEWQGIIDL
uniref:Uncharacterized protein n=1 Tax=Musa acuminata subsp. malaccensis TaxID=214687 RepID=A0A804V5Q4_MUSAM